MVSTHWINLYKYRRSLVDKCNLFCFNHCCPRFQEETCVFVFYPQLAEVFNFHSEFKTHLPKAPIQLKIDPNDHSLSTCMTCGKMWTFRSQFVGFFNISRITDFIFVWISLRSDFLLHSHGSLSKIWQCTLRKSMSATITAAKSNFVVLLGW